MTGGLLVNQADRVSTPDNSPQPPGIVPAPGLDRIKQLIRQLDKELSAKLTPDQKSKIEKIISEGQAQIGERWKTNGMGEFVKQVNQQVVQEICGQLTPDQQKQFEDMLTKHPTHRPNSTNSPATNHLSLTNMLSATNSTPRAVARPSPKPADK